MIHDIAFQTSLLALNATHHAPNLESVERQFSGDSLTPAFIWT